MTETDVLAMLHDMTRGTLAERMGLTITGATVERVTGTMPVAGNTQPYGLLHGGASCVLAETLASIGAMLVGQPDRVAVGVDINATHHRAVRDGVVTGTATPLHAGRTMTTWQVAVTDEAGRAVCTSRVTCALLDRPPGS